MLLRLFLKLFTKLSPSFFLWSLSWSKITAHDYHILEQIPVQFKPEALVEVLGDIVELVILIEDKVLAESVVFVEVKSVVNIVDKNVVTLLGLVTVVKYVEVHKPQDVVQPPLAQLL